MIVDGGVKLVLNNTTINGDTTAGATINDYSAAGGGTIEVLVASEIAGTSSADIDLNGNNVGIVTLDAGLTLDYVALNGITIEGGSLTIADTVEVAGAVTLLDDTVTNGGTILIDGGDTLTLDGGTSVTGGALTFGLDTSTLDVEGAGSPAATLDDVTVTGGGTIDIGTTTPATPATLLIDGGTSVTGGDLTFGGSTDILDVEGAGSPAATLDDVTVTGGGTIDIGTTTPATPATLLIDGGTSVTGGDLTFGGSTDVLDVEPTGATLDDVLVTGGGTINVGTLAAATLTLDGGTSITGGTLNLDNGSTLDVEDGPAATLDGVTVSNSATGDTHRGRHPGGGDAAP